MVIQSEQHKRVIGFGIYLALYIGILLFLIFYWSVFITPQFGAFGPQVQELLVRLSQLIQLLLAVVCTWLFLFFTDAIIREHLEETKNKKEILLLVKIYRFSVWALILIVLLAMIFRGFEGLIASIGLIGAALALALQKPIMNIVGWLVIIVNKPFAIGDFIQVGAVEGEVTDIQLMFTTLRTQRGENERIWGKIVNFPNEFVLTSSVGNYSAKDHWISDEVRMSISFESNWKLALSDLRIIAEEVVKENVFDLKREEAGFLEKLAIEKLGNRLGLRQNGKNSNQKVSIDNVSRTEPRITVQDSWIQVRVRYLTTYKDLTYMRSQIEERFLDKAATRTEYEIAYPHVRYVNNNPTRSESVKKN